VRPRDDDLQAEHPRPCEFSQDLDTLRDTVVNQPLQRLKGILACSRDDALLLFLTAQEPEAAADLVARHDRHGIAPPAAAVSLTIRQQVAIGRAAIRE
jgi:hypothetical protein